jgi:hypothetical protein
VFSPLLLIYYHERLLGSLGTTYIAFVLVDAGFCPLHRSMALEISLGQHMTLQKVIGMSAKIS